MNAQEQPTDQLIKDKQLSLLFAHAGSVNTGNIIIAIVVFLVLKAGNNDSATLSFWLVAIIFLATARFYVGHRHQQGIAHFASSHLLHKYVFLTLLLGIAWGSLPLLEYLSADLLSRNFVLAVILGIIAASVTSVSVWLPCLFAYILPPTAGLISGLVMAGDRISLITAAGIVLYTGFIASVGRNMNRNARESLQLQARNSALINSLSQEIDQRKTVQDQLEEHQEHLEQKVTNRTIELINTNKELEEEIKERQKIEANLQYLAHHDPLTSLPNRTLLIDRIEHAIKLSQREKNALAILFLDLDRFKNINDTLGHTVGDSLLLEVSERLKGVLRKSDTVARNGGDEFVIILEGINSVGAAATTAAKIIQSICETYTISGHDLHIGISIGIAVYPTDGNDPHTLLKNADTAMYRAKESGGNHFQFYAENMSHMMQERLVMENKLRTALDNNEFFMMYQPQVDARTNKTVGFEALLRWKNPELGLVSPAQFVPILEETGLIYSVGEWAVQHVAQFIQSGVAGTTKIAVNLSALQCRKLSFAGYIKQTIDLFGIDASQLEFEITESLLVEDFKLTNQFFSELNKIGCKIALDDFGTGYTSMSYLTQLPIDIIKIDRIFVKDIITNPNLHSIVHAIITMSEGLNISNVIEGVETEEQLEKVKSLGGNIIQGFLFSKPLEQQDIPDWLARH